MEIYTGSYQVTVLQAFWYKIKRMLPIKMFCLFWFSGHWSKISWKSAVKTFCFDLVTELKLTSDWKDIWGEFFETPLSFDLKDLWWAFSVPPSGLLWNCLFTVNTLLFLAKPSVAEVYSLHRKSTLKKHYQTSCARLDVSGRGGRLRLETIRWLASRVQIQWQNTSIFLVSSTFFFQICRTSDFGLDLGFWGQQ